MINSLLIVAVNLADCVYFRYTQKRFTADEIFFADNSNSAQLVLKFAAENWYLLLVGAVLIWLLVWGYGRKDHTPIAPARGLGLLLGQYGTAGDRHSARHRRHAGRRNAHDPSDHSLERHALRLDQRKGQPDPEQPLCILRTIGSGGSVKYTRYFSPEKLDEYFTPTHRPDSSAVNLEGRNVMVSF